MKRITLPSVFEYQRRAIFGPERWSVIFATTKAGKTVGCILWMLSLAGGTHDRHRNYWWVAPVYTQSQIAFNRTCELMRSVDPAKAAWGVNVAEMRIDFGRKSSMHFKSADNPDSLYGEDVWGAVIDEAPRCKEEAWHAVRSTLTATGGPCRIIGNVQGRQNWAYKLGERARAGREGWSFAKITAHDAMEAGIFSRAEFDDARASLPDHVFRELYLAEPSEDGANPFGLQHIQACTGESAGGPVSWGIDLARKQDYTVVVGLNDAGGVVAFDRWHHLPWGETVERIARHVGSGAGYADSTGVGDAVVENIRKACPNVDGFLFTQASKQKLIEGLCVGVQQRQTRFPPGVLADEMSTFEYVPTRTGVRYSAPDGMHDDAVCALAMAWAKHAEPRMSIGIGVCGNGADEEESERVDWARAREDRLAAFMRGE